AVSVNTVNGALTVAQPVNATTGAVALTAGSTGAANALTINAAVTGTSGVVLTADNMVIATAVNAGASLAKLLTFQAATKIDVGGADVSGTPNTLGLTNTELGFVTASRIQIGAATSATPYVVPVTFFNTG